MSDWDQVRETIAEEAHERWMRWAKPLMPELKKLTKNHIAVDGQYDKYANCACKTCQRITRWQSLFVSYSELTEAQKQQDRDEIAGLLSLLASLGLVLEVPGSEIWVGDDKQGDYYVQVLPLEAGKK